MPELKDMTYQQMLDYCTWDSIELLTKGTPLRNVIRSAIDISAAWRREKSALAAEAPNGEKDADA